jgi:hypothetical protein
MAYIVLVEEPLGKCPLNKLKYERVTLKGVLECVEFSRQ